jgi:hypothetical protein
MKINIFQRIILIIGTLLVLKFTVLTPNFYCKIGNQIIEATDSNNLPLLYDFSYNIGMSLGILISTILLFYAFKDLQIRRKPNPNKKQLNISNQNLLDIEKQNDFKCHHTPANLIITQIEINNQEIEKIRKQKSNNKNILDLLAREAKLMEENERLETQLKNK